MPKPKIAILSGAGISVESGLSTFRGAGGLWEGYKIDEVATPEGWIRNPGQVLDFYNKRRKQAQEAQPNAGHKILARMEDNFDVVVITQNVDDLHERGGSTRVLHLHGQLNFARSTKNADLIVKLDSWQLNLGDLAADGSQLRPHIVWFDEEVPMMEKAIDEMLSAEALVVVGTSLQVYPAASLVHYVPTHAPIFVVDPDQSAMSLPPRVIQLMEPASIALEKVYADLLKRFN